MCLSAVNKVTLNSKVRGAFSGVPATKNFFTDWLHLLDFFGKVLCRFPVKMLQLQYHVSIMFVSGLYQAFHQRMTFLSIYRKCRIDFFHDFQKLFFLFAILGFQCVVRIGGRIASIGIEYLIP